MVERGTPNTNQTSRIDHKRTNAASEVYQLCRFFGWKTEKQQTKLSEKDGDDNDEGWLPLNLTSSPEQKDYN